MYHVVSLAGHALCDLAFVVGEDEVHTSSVDVEVFAQVLAPHCRTLAVPAGETVAPRRGPAHDVFGLGVLPQGKVGRVAFLVLSVQLASGVEHVVQVTAR